MAFLVSRFTKALRVASLGISFLCATITGCAVTPIPLVPVVVKVTYQSDPAGATIYRGGQAVGATPLTMSYTFYPGHQTQGFMNIVPLRAQ